MGSLRHCFLHRECQEDCVGSFEVYAIYCLYFCSYVHLSLSHRKEEVEVCNYKFGSCQKCQAEVTNGECLEQFQDTVNESIDPSFDLDSSLISDAENIVDNFCEEWVFQLDRDDKVSLGIVLADQLQNHLSVGATNSAELAGHNIGQSLMTVESWRSHFLENGKIPESYSRKYYRQSFGAMST